MNCEYCKWFEKHSEHGKRGLCRVNPPIMIQMANRHLEYDEISLGVWPDVDISDWCGKFER